MKGKALSTSLAAMAVCGALAAGEKKTPQGHVEDDSVAISAAIVSLDQVKQIFGSDFDGNFTVVNVTVSPKGDKPYAVRLDDFILRSESSGDHTGPLSAGQIAGAGAMVVERTYGNRPNAESSRPIDGTKVQIKDDAKVDPAFDALKKKILIEKTTPEPEAGFLFFPLFKGKAEESDIEL